MLRKIIHKPITVVIISGFLVFLLVNGLRNGGYLEFLELSAYDWFIRLTPKQTGQSPWITIIAISEEDIQAIGHWPLSDKTIAQALTIILNRNPRAVGLDVYRDIPVPPGSEELNQIFVDNPNVIGIMTVGDKGIAPLKAIRNTEQAAFGDIIVDPGGIVRKGLLFLDDGQTYYTSFALTLASIYLAGEGIYLRPDPVNPTFIRLKKTTIKPLEENDGGYKKMDARGYQFLLDFGDAAVPFRSYSFIDLLSKKIPTEAINNRIILIGVRSGSVKDFFYTPLSSGFNEKQQLAGIDLQGYITSQLLRFALDDLPSIQVPRERDKNLWLLLWALLGSVLGIKTRSSLRFSLLVSGGLLLIFFLAYGAFVIHWWIPFVPPVCAFIFSAGGVTAYVTGYEQRERVALMQIFSKHVSTEVADMIWEQRDQFLSNGRPKSQQLTATVFFSDLRGFTTVSEKMSPQELIDWLNTYMEPMASLIMKYGGVVDSYAGDGIKADFGVPIPRQTRTEICNDARNAVSCALDMEQELYRLNAVWENKGLPKVGIRIGIFTGPVVGGLLGSTKRLKYTTIGDTVNIASRLESYNKDISKESPCRILIGDSTLSCLEGQYKTERIGEVKLKGKEKTVTIHQVLNPVAPVLNPLPQEVNS